MVVLDPYGSILIFVFPPPKTHCQTKQQNEQRYISSWVPHLLNLDQSKCKQHLGKKIIPDFGQIPLRPLLGKENIQVEEEYSMRKKDDKMGIKTGHG